MRGKVAAGRESKARWRAVLAHDQRYDGAFVYGVRSTGIYCRPSCSSRRPKRPQVVFFPVPAAAEQAGFRPCRRCRPDTAALRDAQKDMVERAARHIERSLDAPLSLKSLAGEVGVSGFHLQRTFKRVLGITPRQYADSLRMGGVKSRLRAGRSVTEALYDVGYGSSSRLYERAAGKLGMTPATYRRGGKGMSITYTTAASPLGRLLVARTERGICAVSLADSERELESRLRHEYPQADVRRDRNGLTRTVSTLMRYLEGRQPRLDLPLDIRGTAFQCRVWEELLRIPYGKTRTYGEVAKAIGKPGAARAVGTACGSNPVPLIVPCHRVVRGGGTLGGYGLGLPRKKALLEMETRASV
ncbi:MAG TPA: bifunctional DNA-binding transcriptional regulator/O6-methylguanine-DNA methyltransferase Ada [Candidatus Xenobia bacterium]|nr:bifunctional DNA-binding transcriptional regulator/O6-methylguanine-DNA methyltransferase Ada [Candidatus Xenobia bacterium]